MKKRNLYFYLIMVFILILLLLCSIFYNSMLSYLNSFLWAVATVMILGSGLFFSIKLKFVQLNFKEMFKSFKEKKKDKEGVSALESLAMSLGGRIGVGSLAGVALSIYIGGEGSIFWMWITSLIASSNAFSESVLGVIFHEKDSEKIYKGGPSYYIRKGLNSKKLASLYALLIIISYIIGFLGIQSNTIVKSINSITPVNPYLIIIIIALASSFVIIKGVKKIATFSSIIVPIMGILYIIFGIYVLLVNINLFPTIIMNIIKSAFNFKSFLGGFLSTFIIGLQRGIFSNEAGLGTSAIASSTTNNHPVKQGFVQVFGIHITTLVICTITAFIILTSNYQSLTFIDINGIEITQNAFSYHLGDFGSIFLSIIVSLFAFSTIISGYYYGESSLKFLFKHLSNTKLLIFKIISIIIISIGGLVTATSLWNLVDIFVALLAIINIYAILHLYKDVVYELKEYRLKKGIYKG